MPVSETQLPALVRDGDEKPHTVKPRIKAKVGKSKRAPNGRHPWYDQAWNEVMRDHDYREADRHGLDGDTPIREVVTQLVTALEANDIPRASAALREVDRHEAAIREAEESAAFTLGLFQASNEENARLREYMEVLGGVEGGLLSRMGIEDI